MASTNMANTTTYTLSNITVANGGYATSASTGSVLLSNGSNGTGYYTLSGAGTYPSWTTNMTQNNIQVGKVNITDSDITIDGISLRDTLNKLQERLAILVPDPKKLEQYEALKQAYEHYKTLEGLCSSTENEDKK